MQFGTNHLGHFLLTKLLLPVLRRSQPSRIVTTSSAAHYFPELVGGHNMTDIFADSNATYSPWPAYGRSKLANVLFTMRLADELRGDRVYATVRLPEPEGQKIIAVGWATYPTLPTWTWPGRRRTPRNCAS